MNPPVPFFPRRKFIKTAMTASAAALIAPYVRSGEKSGTRLPVVGEGGHTYECIHDWGGLPPGLAYGVTHGVVQDAAGCIYIMQRPQATSALRDAVVVYEPSGRFIRSWGSEYQAGAHGLHLAWENGQEYFYLADPVLREVIKTTLTGEVVWRRGCPFESGCYQSVEGYKPTNIATAPDGTVFVADGYGSNYIHIYGPDGSYVKTFGGTGNKLGQLDCPHGILVDTRGPKPLLVVADRRNHRLHYFSLSGEPLHLVDQELRLPCHFHQREGMLLIPDLQSRVSLFDRDNRLITHLGDGGDFKGIRDQLRSAFTPGKFVAPHSAIFDRDGNIFVVEWVEVGRVTKLRRIT